MTHEHQAVLTEAARLVGQIEELQAKLSAILEPVVEQAIMEDIPDKTYTLIQTLPRSVERTELRTHHITRLGDFEYRRRFSHSSFVDHARSRQTVEETTGDSFTQ